MLYMYIYSMYNTYISDRNHDIVNDNNHYYDYHYHYYYYYYYYYGGGLPGPVAPYLHEVAT